MQPKKRRIQHLKSDIFILYYASKDPRVPWQAKALVMLLAAYIISPIDLLSDFVIPGLGYIDDMVLIPLGAEVILKMIPETIIRGKVKGHAFKAKSKKARE